MLASFNTHDYGNPKIYAKNRVLTDRWDAEQLAWVRAPYHMRRPGYFQGVDALLVRRDGFLQPVALCDLTALELDKMLTVPALTTGGVS